MLIHASPVRLSAKSELGIHAQPEVVHHMVDVWAAAPFAMNSACDGAPEQET